MAEKGQYIYEYPRPSVTTDCVIFGYDGKTTRVLLVQRGGEPFKGQWAFPGGFLEMDENALDCARRELEEETGLKEAYVEQLHTFTDVNRDPRERVVTIAYYMLVKTDKVKGGDDAAKAQWFPVGDIPQLAFDHDRILRMATSRLKEQMHTEPVGFELLPETFTMSDLQNLYESVLEVHFDQRHFSSKILQLGILDEAGEVSSEISSKPAKIYRFNQDKYQQMKAKGFRLEF